MAKNQNNNTVAPATKKTEPEAKKRTSASQISMACSPVSCVKKWA